MTKYTYKRVSKENFCFSGSAGFVAVAGRPVQLPFSGEFFSCKEGSNWFVVDAVSGWKVTPYNKRFRTKRDAIQGAIEYVQYNTADRGENLDDLRRMAVRDYGLSPAFECVEA